MPGNFKGPIGGFRRAMPGGEKRAAITWPTAPESAGHGQHLLDSIG